MMCEISNLRFENSADVCDWLLRGKFKELSGLWITENDTAPASQSLWKNNQVHMGRDSSRDGAKPFNCLQIINRLAQLLGRSQARRLAYGNIGMPKLITAPIAG